MSNKRYFKCTNTTNGDYAIRVVDGDQYKTLYCTGNWKDFYHGEYTPLGSNDNFSAYVFHAKQAENHFYKELSEEEAFVEML